MITIKTRGQLFRAIKAEFNVSESDIRLRNRVRKVSTLRHIAMYLIRKHLHMTFEAIGEVLNRNHSSVIHGCNKVTMYLETKDPLILFYYNRVLMAVNRPAGYCNTCTTFQTKH